MLIINKIIFSFELFEKLTEGGLLNCPESVTRLFPKLELNILKFTIEFIKELKASFIVVHIQGFLNILFIFINKNKHNFINLYYIILYYI